LYLAKFLDTSAKLLFPCKVAFRWSLYISNWSLLSKE